MENETSHTSPFPISIHSAIETIHTPVLMKNVMELLAVKEDGTYIDATVGLGGHAKEIIARLGVHGKLIGIDRDADALRFARERLGNGRVWLRKGKFSHLEEILRNLNVTEADGVLFDLGVSMFQFKELKRGFSFLSDAPLDMRMDTAQEVTAWDLVNRSPEKEIERILREYGEEPYARKIARAIVVERQKTSIDSCASLADLVQRACRRRGRTHPATRTFQAFRIEVNKEIDELEDGLKSALNILKIKGRLCVISYHSIEDRVVKTFVRDNSRRGLLKMLTKKPIAPHFDEMRKNRSSRSAKLRGAEKL